MNIYVSSNETIRRRVLRNFLKYFSSAHQSTFEENKKNYNKLGIF
jgi:hypothetical protein